MGGLGENNARRRANNKSTTGQQTRQPKEGDAHFTISEDGH